MATALTHRGPDDQGVWADHDAGVALGHRRLAILDLSSEGHQPMRSADGRYWVAFNGEIYNFRDLRAELRDRGHGFRGHSDTEVMLAAFCEWGIRATLQRCIGMFALAAWDNHARSLLLARDRAGEKPLYYGWTAGVFVFGSELKALRAHPRWRNGVDRRGVALLTRFGYIPAPLSVYQNIYKLPPGCTLTLTEGLSQSQATPNPKPYWSLKGAAQDGIRHPFAGTAREATNQLERLLLDSVRQQMVADVPLGAFLSGGIDSSLVVALMQAQSVRPVRTFSIGFRQAGFDEAPFAKSVARHLGTEHTELYVTPADLRQLVPRLPVTFDEPFADPSQIPTLALCELARGHVTVSLSGDAGDELFGGYPIYRKAQRLWPIIRHIPRFLRGGIARGLRCAATSGWERELQLAPVRRLLGRMGNLADLLPVPNDRELYRLLMSPNRDPLPWLKNGAETGTQFDDLSLWEAAPEMLHRMMCVDFGMYLADDILVKVDRAAMSVALETRIPLLDHRIVEFAWRLPASLKQKGGCGKWLLRQVLYRYVPAALVERPKQGFAAPVSEWLRGPLRSWAEDLLAASGLRGDGYFNERVVRRKWAEHLTGRRDSGVGLWHILMFQAWLQQHKRPLTVAAEETVSGGRSGKAV